MADEKVNVEGKPVTRNKSLLRKFGDTFSFTNMKDARDYIITDVVIPGFFDLLYDGATRGLARLIYGEKGVNRARKKVGGIDYSTGIKRLSDGESFKRDRRNADDSVVSISDYNEIELETKAKAEQLLDDMCEYLDCHDIVSVADMYQMAKYKGGDYTDNYWGWSSLAGAHITRSEGGWTLVLPRAVNLKDIK